MKRMCPLAALLTVALLPIAAHAETHSLAVRGSTLGYGLEYGAGFNSHSLLRLGANSGKFSGTETDGGVDYDYEWKMRSGSLLLDWHPFGGVFFTSIGAFYNKNKFETKAKTGTVNIGGTNYSNPDLRGEVTFKTFAPYLGFGWGTNPMSKGFMWKIDLGVMYQGSPQVQLRSNSGVSQADLDREAADLQDSIKDFKYYPNIGLAFGVRF